MPITVDAAVAGIIITLLGGLIAVAVRAGVLSEKVRKTEEAMKEMEDRFKAEKDAAIEQHCKDMDEAHAKIDEHKEHNDKRIAELYDSRNDTRVEVSVLANSMQTVVQSITEMRKDLRDFMNEVKK